MSHWKRLSRKHRAFYLMIAVLALAATALASTRLAPSRTASAGKSEEPVSLGGRLPPPADVFIRLTSDFPELGNVLVMVKLTPEQVAAKKKDGTESFATLGSFGEILFRDDGESGDATAGDALYTAVARVDLEALQKRSRLDEEELKAGNARTPLFSGRALTGTRTQEAFDFAGLQAGRTVPLDPAVVGLKPIGSRAGSSKSALGSLSSSTTTSFEDKVLMIRDPDVVTDPDRTINPCTLAGNGQGVWTFNHLITEMANQTASGIDPAVFAEKWLANWTFGQTINSFGVPERSQMKLIIEQWRAASGGEKLDLKRAPLRLLAIVPRLDVRQSRNGGGGYGGAGSGPFLDAGEARFVFGFVLPKGWRLRGGYEAPVIDPNGCRALPFSVIFEYRVPKSDCPEVRDWAQRWLDLDNLTLGSPSYNAALEILTEEFVKANAAPGQPNGSAIGQIRTNEIALEEPWQLRQFQLTDLPWSGLHETMTNESAEDGFNNTSVFKDWILNQVSPFLTGPPWDQPISSVPATFLSAPFQGSRPEMPTAGFFWEAPGLSLSPNGGDNAENWGRHRASLASCNGCHAGETSTRFVHIDPSTPGLPADLSGFLTGINVNDPAEAFGLPQRTFSDLARRAQDLQQLAKVSCARFASVDVARVSAELAKTGRIPKNPFPNPPSEFQSVAADNLKANHITEVH